MSNYFQIPKNLQRKCIRKSIKAYSIIVLLIIINDALLDIIVEYVSIFDY